MPEVLVFAPNGASMLEITRAVKRGLPPRMIVHQRALHAWVVFCPCCEFAEINFLTFWSHEGAMFYTFKHIQRDHFQAPWVVEHARKAAAMGYRSRLDAAH